MTMNRRSFLKAAAAMGASLTGRTCPRTACPLARAAGAVSSGVASGDPDPHSVILWTRRPFESGTREALTVEVAEDEAFQRVIAHAPVAVSLAMADWTARVLIGGLKPARTCWYRFTDSEGNGSGSNARSQHRCRTIPAR